METTIVNPLRRDVRKDGDLMYVSRYLLRSANRRSRMARGSDSTFSAAAARSCGRPEAPERARSDLALASRPKSLSMRIPRQSLPQSPHLHVAPSVRDQEMALTMAS
jgi:hypothetical protein